jgi:hypothetical protein
VYGKKRNLQGCWAWVQAIRGKAGRAPWAHSWLETPTGKSRIKMNFEFKWHKLHTDMAYCKVANPHEHFGQKTL